MLYGGLLGGLPVQHRLAAQPARVYNGDWNLREHVRAWARAGSLHVHHLCPCQEGQARLSWTAARFTAGCCRTRVLRTATGSASSPAPGPCSHVLEAAPCVSLTLLYPNPCRRARRLRRRRTRTCGGSWSAASPPSSPRSRRCTGALEMSPSGRSVIVPWPHHGRAKLQWAPLALFAEERTVSQAKQEFGASLLCASQRSLTSTLKLGCGTIGYGATELAVLRRALPHVQKPPQQLEQAELC